MRPARRVRARLRAVGAAAMADEDGDEDNTRLYQILGVDKSVRRGSLLNALLPPSACQRVTQERETSLSPCSPLALGPANTAPKLAHHGWYPGQTLCPSRWSWRVRVVGLIAPVCGTV